MKRLPRRASGATNGVPCNSASLWMILVLNMWALNISTICLTYSRNSIPYSLTWLATNLLESQSNGIILASAANSACPDTLIISSSNSNTLTPPSHVSLRMHAYPSPMVPSHSSRPTVIHQLFLMANASSASRKLSAPFSTTPMRWTTNSLWHSVP